MDAAKQLMAERDKIDEQIEENFQVLVKNNCTMDNPLTDAEDFPIASIDVYGVRHARHNIICLRNDRKAINDKLEDSIAEIHELNSKADKEDMEDDDEPPVHRTSNTPFVKISSVADGSPASNGGLRVGDEIVQYGQLHHGNFKALNQLAEETKRRENKSIRVTALRNQRPIRLTITPQQWSGKGTLGCAFQPVNP